MSAARKKWNRRGFTLMEVLIVVAIIAILTALTLPGLLRSWRSMKLTELDDGARQIFLSAQNELTDWKASTGVTQLNAKMDDYESSGTIQLNDTTDVKYYRLTSQNTRTLGFDQTAALLDTMGGSYVMDLCAATGDVLGVYYAKRDDLKTEDVEGLDVTKEDARAAAGIGYYGSDDLSNKTLEVPTATLEFINDDDLYIKLAVPNVPADAGSVTFTITLKNQNTDEVIRQWEEDSFALNQWKNVRFYETQSARSADSTVTRTYYILVDSLQTNCRFYDFFTKRYDQSGDDLKVSVSNLTINDQMADVEVLSDTQNSLYQKLNSETVGVTKNVDISVANVRHLFNLDCYDDRSDDEDIKNNNNVFVNAVLTSDIDFAKYAKTSDNPTDWPNVVTHPSTFPKVVFSYYKHFTLDGNGHRLSNFNLQDGFFSCNESGTPNLTLQNLNVVNPSFTDSAGKYAGTLVSVTGAAGAVLKISNCRVWLEKNGADNMTTTLSEHTISGNSSAVPLETAVKNAVPGVGSLVGSSTGTLIITDSFAALPVSGTGSIAQNVGGLVGSCAGKLTLTNSYSSCAVNNASTDAASATGGLVGSAAGSASAISGCYSTSDVTASVGTAGTLAGTAGGLTLSGCTAYSTVTTGETTTYGPVVGGTDSTNVTYSDCHYLSQSGNEDVADAYGESLPDGLTAHEYGDLVATPANTAANSNPYGTPPEDHPIFPFTLLTRINEANQTETIPHYGDWPAEIEPAESTIYGLCYYEKYDDGTYGFYGYDKAGNSLNTLQGNERQIQNAGYGVAVFVNEVAKRPHVGTWNYATLSNSPEELQQYGIDLYTITDAMTKFPSYQRPYYENAITDEQTGRQLYINPKCAAALTMNPADNSEQVPLQIRTEFQLTSMLNVAVELWLKQTHDIKIESDQTEMINGNRKFVFDGGGNRIMQLKKPLFDSVACTLKNIVLTDVEISGNDVAPLAKVSNGGTVENCRVIGGTITAASYGGDAAGFIARTDNSTQITNCYTANCTVTATKGSASGFICSAQGTISNCHANNTVKSTGGKAAGFIIEITNKLAQITNCYTANCTVLSSSGTASGFICSAQGTITNCRVGSSSAVSTVESTIGSAAGLVCTADDGTIKGCSVENITVTGCSYWGSDPGAAGFAGTISGCSISDCSVTNATISCPIGSTRASGFITFANSPVTNCSVTGGAVTSAQYAAGFCIDNYSQITGCSAKSVEVQGDKFAAGFAYSNKGNWNAKITYSFVSEGEISGDKAAGFVYINEEWHASVSQCYAELKSVTGTDSAAGFVYKNQSNCTVTDCYAVGTGAIAAKVAAGFCYFNQGGWSSGTIQNCYAIMRMDTGSTSAYGFSPSGGTIKNCYWGRDLGFNVDVASDPIMAKTRAEMTGMTDTLGSEWGSPPHTYPTDLTGEYPYPGLKDLDHYGDWPELPETEFTYLGIVSKVEKKNKGIVFSGCYLENGKEMILEPPDSGSNITTLGCCLLLKETDPQIGWSIQYNGRDCDVREISLTPSKDNGSLTQYRLYQIFYRDDPDYAVVPEWNGVLTLTGYGNTFCFSGKINGKGYSWFQLKE